MIEQATVRSPFLSLALLPNLIGFLVNLAVVQFSETCCGRGGGCGGGISPALIMALMLQRQRQMERQYEYAYGGMETGMDPMMMMMLPLLMSRRQQQYPSPPVVVMPGGSTGATMPMPMMPSYPMMPGIPGAFGRMIRRKYHLDDATVLQIQKGEKQLPIEVIDSILKAALIPPQKQFPLFNASTGLFNNSSANSNVTRFPATSGQSALGNNPQRNGNNRDVGQIQQQFPLQANAKTSLLPLPESDAVLDARADLETLEAAVNELTLSVDNGANRKSLDDALVVKNRLQSFIKDNAATSSSLQRSPPFVGDFTAEQQQPRQAIWADSNFFSGSYANSDNIEVAPPDDSSIAFSNVPNGAGSSDAPETVLAPISGPRIDDIARVPSLPAIAFLPVVQLSPAQYPQQSATLPPSPPQPSKNKLLQMLASNNFKVIPAKVINLRKTNIISKPGSKNKNARQAS